MAVPGLCVRPDSVSSGLSRGVKENAPKQIYVSERFSFGSAYGNRTRIPCVRGMYPNR